jgi:hypothetical protein
MKTDDFFAWAKVQKDFTSPENIAEHFSIETQEALDILEYGCQVGVLYQAISCDNRYKSTYDLKAVVTDQAKKDFDIFLNKFFNSVVPLTKWKKEIKEYYDLVGKKGQIYSAKELNYQITRKLIEIYHFKTRSDNKIIHQFNGRFYEQNGENVISGFVQDTLEDHSSRFMWMK